MDEANALTVESEAIIEYWISEGRADELLIPMLESDSVEVRYAAAAFLARYVPSDLAWRALAEIGRGPHGLISSSAKLLLMNRTD